MAGRDGDLQLEWDPADWVGRTELTHDVAGAGRAAGLAALLDRPLTQFATFPLLGHWLLAPSRVRQSALGVDGHPQRGGDAFLPPIALPRRMWAGSRIRFHAPITIGAAIERHSTIASIERKSGSSGALLFVGIDHRIFSSGTLAISERQDLVYRDIAAAAVRSTPGIAAAKPQGAVDPAPGSHRRVVPDPVLLFRYSALTFNGHRIHYDRDYAVRSEGYPGLVVHGPLIATLLLDHHRSQHLDAAVTGFEFRARAPLFDTAPFTLCSAGDRLWATDEAGTVAMTAEVSRD